MCFYSQEKIFHLGEGVLFKMMHKISKKRSRALLLPADTLEGTVGGETWETWESSLNHPARPCLQPGVTDLPLLHGLYPGAGHEGQDRNASPVQFRLREPYPLPKRRKNLVFSWHFLVLLPEL